MKKFLFLLSAAIILFASCEGPAGRDGLDGLDAELSFYVENITVRTQDWKRVSVGRYVTLYECIKDVDVRENAYEDGVVFAFLFQWNNESNSEVQTPLPNWVQHTDGDNTWLEGYNYDFDHGTVAFYVECRNGTNPPECEFRVVVAP